VSLANICNHGLLALCRLDKIGILCTMKQFTYFMSRNLEPDCFVVLHASLYSSNFAHLTRFYINKGLRELFSAL